MESTEASKYQFVPSQALRFCQETIFQQKCIQSSVRHVMILPSSKWAFAGEWEGGAGQFRQDENIENQEKAETSCKKLLGLYKLI